MANDIEPVSPYHPDPEVESLRIKSWAAIKKADLAHQKAMQEGWQKVANNAIEAFRSHSIQSKEIEERGSNRILLIIAVLVIGVGLLTWQDIVPPEGLTFLVGTAVGYLLSLSPLAKI